MRLLRWTLVLLFGLSLLTIPWSWRNFKAAEASQDARVAEVIAQEKEIRDHTVYHSETITDIHLDMVRFSSRYSHHTEPRHKLTTASWSGTVWQTDPLFALNVGDTVQVGVYQGKVINVRASMPGKTSVTSSP